MSQSQNINMETADINKDDSCCAEHPNTGKKGRNLVVCVDGTSNRFGERNTNVIELYSQVLKDPDCEQLTYYNSGIGTYAQPSWRSPNYWARVILHKIDLAIAWNFEDIIFDAYRWLADNYQKGDKIYLFGFSRGAYQVRVLAGMIHKIGLIHKGNEGQIPFAYELYVKFQSDNHKEKGIYATLRKFFLSAGEKRSEYDEKPNSIEDNSGASQKQSKLADHFKKAFARDVKVHFVGVWDTVSSIGISRGSDTPRTVDPEHVCYFRHALALDERRVKFLPEYARGGVMESTDRHDDASEKSFHKDTQRPNIKEVWFPGTHSDIGGGFAENTDMNSRTPSSLWMSYEALSAGLKLNLGASQVEWDWEKLGQVHESLKGAWKILEWIPIKRLSYEDDRRHIWGFHQGGGRQIQPGQKIHVSIAHCQKYPVRARLSPGETRDLNTLVGVAGRYAENISDLVGGWNDMLEWDIYDYSKARHVISKLEQLCDGDQNMWLYRLKMIVSSDVGRRELGRIEKLPCCLLNILKSREASSKFNVTLLNLLAQLHEIPSWKPSVQSPETHDALKTLLSDGKKDHVCSFVVTLADYLSDELQPLIPNWCECLIEMLNPEDPEGEHKGLSIAMIAAIPTLAKNDTLRSKIKGAILDSLSSHLQCSDREIRMTVLAMLPRLMMYDDCRPQLLELKFLDPLKQGIWAGEAKIVDVVTAYVQHKECRKVMIRDHFLESLREFPPLKKYSKSPFVAVTIELVKYDELRQMMLDLGFLEDLRNIMLEDNDWDTRLASAKAFAVFADYADCHKEMVRISFLNSLRKMYSKAGNRSITEAVDIVTEFANCRIFRSKVLKTHFLKELTDMLGNDDLQVQLSSVRAITAFAMHEDCRQEMIAVGFIDLLQKMFRSNKLRKSSVDAVAECAKYDQLRTKMLESNFLKCLANMLRNKDWDVQLASARALAVFAAHEDCRRKMIEDHCLDSLKKITDKTERGLKKATIYVVEEMVKYDELRTKILGSHFLQDLNTMLNDKASDVRVAAAKGFVALAKHNECRSKMIEIGCTDSLRRMLCDIKSVPDETLFDIVAELVKYEEIRNMMLESHSSEKLKEPHLLDKLKDMLRVGTYDSNARLVSAKGIKIFAQYDNCQSKMIEIGLMKLLQSMLHSTESRVTSLEIVTEFAKHAILRKKMLESNFLKDLQDMFSLRKSRADSYSSISGISTTDNDSNVRVMSTKAITVFAKHDECQDEIIRIDFLSCLQKAFGHAEWTCRESAVEAVGEFAKYEIFRRKMLESHFLEDLKKMLYDESLPVRLASVNAIAIFASHDDQCDVITFGFVDYLYQMFNGSNWKSRQISLNAVAECAHHEKLRSKMLESHFLEYLRYLLDDSDCDVQLASAKAIVAFAKHDNSRRAMNEIYMLDLALQRLQMLSVNKRADVRRRSVEILRCMKDSAQQ